MYTSSEIKQRATGPVACPQIVETRQNIDFDRQDLCHLLYGGKASYDNMKSIMKMYSGNQGLRNDPAFLDFERNEMMEYSFKRLNRQMRFDPNGVTTQNAIIHTLLSKGTQANNLHKAMFEVSVRYLGDDAQNQKWLKKIMSNQIIGSYGQTELGHGSNVRGLETEAVLDKQTDEWVINTPRISSAKFWPGDMGLIGNHTVLYAKMIIDGQSYGVQAFMVPIRDMETHRPLKGIEVGDIGPKFGFQAKDNGYAIFKNVRIPRGNLLQRYIGVYKEGAVSLKGNPKVLYSIMMQTRLALMEVCSHALSAAITIVLRHSLVTNNYKNIYIKKQLATMSSFLFGMNFSCLILFQQYNKNMNLIQKKNDFSMLGPLHQVLAGLKALWCGETFEHCKSLSYLCQEAGYHSYSGFAKIIDQLSPFVTLEGDAVVMNLQTAKSLIKKGYKVLSGKQPNLLKKQTDYVNLLPEFRQSKKKFRCIATSKQDLTNEGVLLDLLKFNSLHHLSDTLVLFAKYKELSTWEKFFYKCELELIKISELHSWYMTANYFHQFIDKIDVSCDRNLLDHLQRMFRILCLDVITKFGDSLVMNKHMTGEQLQWVHELLDDEINAISGQLFNLVECWDWDDNALLSVLAPEDGKFSNRMFSKARVTKFNDSDTPKGFNEYMKPILKAKL